MHTPQEILDRADTAGIPYLVLHEGHVAELPLRPPARDDGWLSVAGECLRVHLEVKADLIVELAIEPAAGEERAKAAKQATRRQHGIPPYASERTRVTAATKASQFSRSRESWRRPAAVIR